MGHSVEQLLHYCLYPDTTDLAHVTRGLPVIKRARFGLTSTSVFDADASMALAPSEVHSGWRWQTCRVSPWLSILSKILSGARVNEAKNAKTAPDFAPTLLPSKIETASYPLCSFCSITHKAINPGKSQYPGDLKNERTAARPPPSIACERDAG